jgi:catechol 2,3-dioxygenase-like lactoylglutathione lyase family enzyme
MLNYATVGSNRLDDAKRFYDELLELVDMAAMFDHPSGGRLYASSDRRMFGVLGPYDGNPASVGNGSMVGFALDTRDKVRAFHAKALELGGSCEGPPDLRGPEELGAFFAYFRDLDGNKLCAYRWGPE